MYVLIRNVINLIKLSFYLRNICCRRPNTIQVGGKWIKFYVNRDETIHYKISFHRYDDKVIRYDIFFIQLWSNHRIIEWVVEVLVYFTLNACLFVYGYSECVLIKSIWSLKYVINVQKYRLLRRNAFIRTKRFDY